VYKIKRFTRVQGVFGWRFFDFTGRKVYAAFAKIAIYEDFGVVRR
jgi:hypothetical protein